MRRSFTGTIKTLHAHAPDRPAVRVGSATAQAISGGRRGSGVLRLGGSCPSPKYSSAMSSHPSSSCQWSRNYGTTDALRGSASTDGTRVSSQQHRVCLIGLGFHARKVHYPALESMVTSSSSTSTSPDQSCAADVAIPLIVDVQGSQAPIRDFLQSSSRTLLPEKVLLLDRAGTGGAQHPLHGAAGGGVLFDFTPGASGWEVGVRVHDVREVIRTELQRSRRCIIGTDARSHRDYLDLANECGSSTLIDKPLSCPVNINNDRDVALEFWNHYQSLLCVSDTSNKGSSRDISVLVQRRYHPQYQYVVDFLSDVVSSTNVPVSGIHISEADGKWTMPTEWQLENHPYHGGYGKLMHSGYHMVDLWNWIHSINSSEALSEEKRPQSFRLQTCSFDPLDAVHQLNVDDLRRHFAHDDETVNAFPDLRDSSVDEVEAMRGYGELDSYNILQSFSQTESRNGGADEAGRRRVCSSATLNMMHNTMSTRSFPHTPTDLYKGSGRIKHEHVNVFVGPFAHVQVLRDDALDHAVYTVHIARNGRGPGGPKVETKRFHMELDGQQDDHAAKKQCIREWVRDPKNTLCSLQSQDQTVRILTAMFVNYFKDRNQYAPVTAGKLAGPLNLL